MRRILDIDLDFFVEPTAHWVSLDSTDRLDSEEYGVWSMEAVEAFLRDRCLLTEPLHGWPVEHHHEAYFRWQEAILDGSLCEPCSITHVDAHADLGMGESVHLEIMTDLMWRPVEERAAAARAVTAGSYIAYACAVGWVADLDYVYGDSGGQDLMALHLKDGDPKSGAIQMKAVTRDDLLSGSESPWVWWRLGLLDFDQRGAG